MAHFLTNNKADPLEQCFPSFFTLQHMEKIIFMMQWSKQSGLLMAGGCV